MTLHDVLEAYERLLHQLGMHGRTNAILLPLMCLTLVVASYLATTLILELTVARRIRERRRRNRPDAIDGRGPVRPVR